MASNSIRITGLNETIRSLKRFGVEVADLKAAFTRIGNVVVNEAQSLVPHMSGDLSASIRASKTQNKSEVRAGSARVPYAGVIHYGGYNNITGTYFLTQAVENKQTDALRLMEADLNRLISSLDLN